MQFDKFDKKVREAADHHHPAYDERAWSKMEQLLNKHLPQEEDNRRRFLFLLFLFLGLGAAGLLITKPWKEKKQVAVTKQVSPVPKKNVVSSTAETQQGELNENKLPTKENPLPADNRTRIKSDQTALTAAVDQQAGKPVSDIRSKKNKTTNTTVYNSSLTKQKNNSLFRNAGKENGIAIAKDRKDKPVISTTAVTTPARAVDPVKDKAPADKKLHQEKLVSNNKPVIKGNVVTDDNSPSVNTTKEDKPPVQDKAKKEKRKSKKSNSFLFTVSAGPDMSFAGNGPLGRMKLLAGAGIGYSFNNRLIIRTGFYSGRKVYTASPEAYHPPAEFYTYYPYVEMINADCKVYEIPLTLSYNFSTSSKNSFMATGGLSSYMMKKETYDYSYKYYPSGPVYKHQLTIDNEYKHFFAVLTLSGGYQRNVSKHVSLLVEPYVKLPLKGAGYGKVKLNSAGVLFSLGIKPFAPKKEKAPVNQ